MGIVGVMTVQEVTIPYVVEDFEQDDNAHALQKLLLILRDKFMQLVFLRPKQ